MSTRLKFQRAQKIIPAEENLDSRDFVLYDGSLYFQGDRAWFKIESFMESNANCILRYADLSPILSLEGDIVATKVDQDKVSFSNGKHELTLHVNQKDAAIPKDIQPPAAHEFADLPELFTRGRNIFGLLNEFASASIITHEEQNPNDPNAPVREGYLALLNEKTFAVLRGEPGLDIDLTDLPEVAKGLVAQKARVKMDKQVVFSMVEDENYVIYGAFKYARSRFPDKHNKFAQGLAHGMYEKDEPEQPVIVVKAKAKEFLEVLPVLEQMRHEGYASIHAGKDTMKVSIVDSVKNLFEAEFPCESSEEVKFEVAMFDRAMIDFLVTSAGAKLDEAQLIMAVNPWKQRMILRVDSEDDINSLCMLKIEV